MGRRSSREISVFNMSMLDVLCSGLGAVLMMLLLIQQQSAAARKKLKEEATFHYRGLHTDKKALMILLDLSGSMKDHPEILGSISRDLLLSLQEAGQDGGPVRFNVMSFQGGDFLHDNGVIGEYPSELRQWREGPDLHSATEENLRSAGVWVEERIRKVGGGTPTREALLRAIRIPDLEAILLVTDGQPTGRTLPEDARASDGTTIPGEMSLTLAEVAAEQQKRATPVEIHAIGIGNKLWNVGASRKQAKADFARFLRALTRRNGGDFVAIPPDPGTHATNGK